VVVRESSERSPVSLELVGVPRDALLEVCFTEPLPVCAGGGHPQILSEPLPFGLSALSVAAGYEVIEVRLDVLAAAYVQSP
jgi:hypothetical protein